MLQLKHQNASASFKSISDFYLVFQISCLQSGRRFEVASSLLLNREAYGSAVTPIAALSHSTETESDINDMRPTDILITLYPSVRETQELKIQLLSQSVA